MECKRETQNNFEIKCDASPFMSLKFCQLKYPFLRAVASHKQHCPFVATDRSGKLHPPSTPLGDPNNFLLFSPLPSVSLYAVVRGYKS